MSLADHSDDLRQAYQKNHYCEFCGNERNLVRQIAGFVLGRIGLCCSKFFGGEHHVDSSVAVRDCADYYLLRVLRVFPTFFQKRNCGKRIPLQI